MICRPVYSLKSFIHNFVTSIFQTKPAALQMIQGKIWQRKSSGEISLCELEMQDMVAWLLSRSPPGEHNAFALHAMEMVFALLFWIASLLNVNIWNVDLGNLNEQSSVSHLQPVVGRVPFLPAQKVELRKK